MLDKWKAEKVGSELIDISRKYGKSRFIFTSNKIWAEDLKRLYSFAGKHKLDDLSVPQKVQELLKNRFFVLIIAEDETMNIYRG